MRKRNPSFLCFHVECEQSVRANQIFLVHVRTSGACDKRRLGHQTNCRERIWRWLGHHRRLGVLVKPGKGSDYDIFNVLDCMIYSVC